MIRTYAIEILKIANEHQEALAAYGADRYAQGYKEGVRKGINFAIGVWAVSFVVGLIIGSLMLM